MEFKINQKSKKKYLYIFKHVILTEAQDGT